MTEDRESNEIGEARKNLATVLRDIAAEDAGEAIERLIDAKIADDRPQREKK